MNKHQKMMMLQQLILILHHRIRIEVDAVARETKDDIMHWSTQAI
ncbi:MAG TPA: hypothetical protein VE076_12410 [Nitrososphaeraceae archaeon]|nr:hypothetical protein [Nitrososphaeraceae archaeon]